MNYPVTDEEFVRFVKISRGDPITPLYREQFEGIKRLLGQQNKVLRDVDQGNWPSTSCATNARFRERFDVAASSVCLVADQSGVYVVSAGKFSGCSPGKPVWRREELDHSIVPSIRDRIRKEAER